MLAPNRERETNSDNGVENLSPAHLYFPFSEARLCVTIIPPNLLAKLVTSNSEVFISSMLRTQRKAKLSKT